MCPYPFDESQGPDVTDQVKDIFFFKNVDGVWKVDKSKRQKG